MQKSAATWRLMVLCSSARQFLIYSTFVLVVELWKTIFESSL